jgi:hypothetical protein
MQGYRVLRQGGCAIGKLNLISHQSHPTPSPHHPAYRLRHSLISEILRHTTQKTSYKEPLHRNARKPLSPRLGRLPASSVLQSPIPSIAPSSVLLISDEGPALHGIAEAYSRIVPYTSAGIDSRNPRSRSLRYVSADGFCPRRAF